MAVRCLRVHDLVTGGADPGDARVVLVDRLWPRGVRKDSFAHDEWCRDVAPSDELRKAFHGGELDWDGFVGRYRDELMREPAAGALAHLADLARDGDLVLAYAARDTGHNHALVVADALGGG